MSYKKVFSATALVTLLSLSNSAFSSDYTGLIEEDEETNYYVRVQYHGEFLNWIGDLKIKEDVSGLSNSESKFAKIVKDNGMVDYKPQYKTSWLAGGVGLGYNLDNMRVEVELLYSKLNVDKDSDSIELHRSAGSDSNDGNLADSSKSAKNSSIAAFKIDNKGISNVAGLVNAYYDIDIDAPVTPYLGLGVGMTRIDFLGTYSFKPVFQIKGGLTYNINPSIKMYAGARYFRAFGDKFKEISPTNKIEASKGVVPSKDQNGTVQLVNKNGTSQPVQQQAASPAFKESTTATATTSFSGVLGVEVGVMFSF